MIIIPIRTRRLIEEVLVGSLFGAGVIAFSHFSISKGDGWSLAIGLFSGCLGVLMLVASFGPIVSFYKKTPALRVTQNGITMYSGFGRTDFLRWENVGEISIHRRRDGTYPNRLHTINSSFYLEVSDLRTPKSGKGPTVLALSEQQTALNLEEVVQQLRNHSIASSKLDSTALNYRYVREVNRLTIKGKLLLIVVLFAAGFTFAPHFITVVVFSILTVARKIIGIFN